MREVEHPDAHASYALIWNKNHTLSHVAEEFIAYVKEESGQQVYYARINATGYGSFICAGGSCLVKERKPLYLEAGGKIQ